MQNDAAFFFKNIQFGYNSKVILNIPELLIPREGMVFIIGPSGIGKSTLLESIGLMSNTFKNFDDSNSAFAILNESINPEFLWSRDEKKLTSIREKLFSFIFQTTNLMPNFSVMENILMAANFTPDEQKDIESEVKFLMKEMSLPEDILNRSPQEISGGQKQRVAFVRALVGQFSILLADEPTGNLDIENSKALFSILSDHIKEKKKVAVIVTHHSELAQEYGNMIIEIIPTNNGYATTRVLKKEPLSFKEGVRS